MSALHGSRKRASNGTILTFVTVPGAPVTRRVPDELVSRQAQDAARPLAGSWPTRARRVGRLRHDLAAGSTASYSPSSAGYPRPGSSRFASGDTPMPRTVTIACMLVHIAGVTGTRSLLASRARRLVRDTMRAVGYGSR